MIRYFIYVSILFLGASSFNSVAAVPTYPLMCRGPVDYAVGTGQQTTVIFLNKNTSRASPDGISLQPGTCAWRDRPIASTEPGMLYFLPDSTFKVRASFIAFSSCAGDSKCVVVFEAYNANSTGDPHFNINNDFVRVYHPNFQK